MKKELSGLEVTGGIALIGSGGSNRIVKQTTAGGSLVIAELTVSDLGLGTPGPNRYVDGSTRMWTDLPVGGGNLDGGNASSTYMASQIHDGGPA